MARKFLMAVDKLMVIGGSAGSMQVLFQVLPLLHPAIHFPILVVLHRGYSPASSLAELFQAKTALRVKEIEDKDPLQAGTLHLAPADYHILIEADKSFAIDFSEKVHFSRPSIDVSLQSAAGVFRQRLGAILLSGANEDGAEGMACVADHGGLTAVQDPLTAEVPIMPRRALETKKIRHVLPPAGLAQFINDFNRL